MKRILHFDSLGIMVVKLIFLYEYEDNFVNYALVHLFLNLPKVLSRMIKNICSELKCLQLEILLFYLFSFMSEKIKRIDLSC